jgi:putative hydrolase of the HAD superfamily
MSMTTKGILFDLYGTLIDIETDESMGEIYRSISRFLTYQGINLRQHELRDLYYRIMEQQKQESSEQHPEINVETIWDDLLIQQGMTSQTMRRRLRRYLAQIYRGLSLKRLKRYPNVKLVLNTLRHDYQMAIVSDAQPCFAWPEIRTVKLEGYFNPVIISADYGFRKPDPRLIRQALEKMSLAPPEVIFVGNDMYRDIYCARQLGIKTIFISSNSGSQAYQDIVPDYVITRFKDLLPALKLLKTGLNQEAMSDE